MTTQHPSAGDRPVNPSMADRAVERANKRVVERRLKGAGIHWARAHVHPMVALRTLACSDCWVAAWPQLAQAWQRQV
jgi:hypothetical protein